MINSLKRFEVLDSAKILGGEIHEITAKVTVNKAKMADKAMNAMT